MRARFVPTTATLILVVASVAACSGGPASTGGRAPGGTSASSAPTNLSVDDNGGGSSTPAGTTKNFDVCTALPPSAATQITGTTFTKAKASETAGVVYSCEYHGEDYALLQISVTTQDGKIGYDTNVSSLKTVGYAPNTVSGVGDEAFSEPDPNGNAGAVGASAFASFGALFGETYIQIGGLTYVTADQGKQIAEQLDSKL